jgi:hypothetical protein
MLGGQLDLFGDLMYTRTLRANQLTAFNSLSRPGRFSRPLAPLMPASWNFATTSPSSRSARRVRRMAVACSKACGRLLLAPETLTADQFRAIRPLTKQHETEGRRFTIFRPGRRR